MRRQCDRGSVVVRLLKVREFIGGGPVKVAALASQFGVCHKTIRRDVAILKHTGLLSETPEFNSGDSMKTCEFYGKECTNGTGLSAHIRSQHKNGGGSREVRPRDNTPPTHLSAELFSVIKGDIHLRGCEFNGGFLVVNGEHLQFYPTLGAAIKSAEVTALAEKSQQAETVSL